MDNDTVLQPVTEGSHAEPEIEAVAAGFNERFIAYVIDALPFVVATYLSLDAYIKGGGAIYSQSLEFKWRMMWMAAYVAYETILSSGGRATLGKLVMGIRVIDKDGGPLSFPKALARAIAYFISALPLNLGFLLALVTPEKRALHDYLAGSRVVSVRDRSDIGDGVVIALSWALMVILAFVFMKTNFLTMGPNEKKQVVAAHRTVYKLGKLEEIYKSMYGFYTDDLKQLARLTGNPLAVKKELMENIDPTSLAIATDGKSFVIKANAKNWQKTEVVVRSKGYSSQNK